MRYKRHAIIRDPGIGKLPLTKPEIVAVPRDGIITEGPVPDIRLAGGWKFTMCRVYERQRSEVVGVLLPDTNILVIAGYKDTPVYRR